MVPEEWPIAAKAADRPVESARLRGGRRLASVRADFFLDPAERLSEQERALMTAMLHDLVGTVAAEILAGSGAAAALPSASDLVAALIDAGLLDRADLIAKLLRRADEHRIGSAFANRAGPRRLPLLPTLVGDGDPGIAAAAMTLVVARGRRRDPFGQPRLELADLSPRDALALVHAVAAALAAETGAADLPLATAAEAALDRRDPGLALDRLLNNLGQALNTAARIDDAMLEAAAAEGDAALLACLLGVRADIEFEAAWEHVVHAGHGRLALLARMVGMGRSSIARILADLDAVAGIAAPDEELQRYDRLSDREVAAARAFWRLPERFRIARDALGGDLG